MTDLKAWANSQREYWLDIDQKARAAGNRSESLDANGRMQAYISVIDKIDAMQAEPPPRWTAIEDAGEMPVDRQVVWAADSSGKVTICRYHDDGDAARAWTGFWMLNTDDKFAGAVCWTPAVTPAPPPFNPSNYEVKP